MPDDDAANNGPVNGKAALLKTFMDVYVHPAHPSAVGPHTPQRILLVEDDPSLATVEANVLTAHGYVVVIVHTGELAVATLHDFVPDLVVLDLELHGTINGWDVLQALRTSAAIPVLLTTSAVSAARKHIRNSGETRGTLDHLPKPYLMQTLLKRVKRMLTVSQ